MNDESITTAMQLASGLWYFRTLLQKLEFMYIDNFESLRLKIAINKSLLGLQLYMHTISKHDVKGWWWWHFWIWWCHHKFVCKWKY